MAKATTKKAPVKKTTGKKAAPARRAQKAGSGAATRPKAKKSVKKPAAPKAKKSVRPSRPSAAAAKTAKKAAKPAVPRVVKTKLDKRFLDQQKEVLLAERAKYLHSADTLQAEADSLLVDREPGDVQFDEESGEGDTLAVERERDLALSAQARYAVEQIDAALARISAGTYGICVVSGLAIPKERLKAIPWASERVEFKAGGLRR